MEKIGSYCTVSKQLRIAYSLGIQECPTWQMKNINSRNGSIQIIAFISDYVAYSLIVNHLDIGDNYHFFSPQSSWQT